MRRRVELLVFYFELKARAILGILPQNSVADFKIFYMSLSKARTVILFF
jgi:hypothetical protein